MTAGEFTFRMEHKVYREFYRATRLRPSSRPFISGDSFRALADHIMEGVIGFDPALVNDGDIVFVETHLIDRFRLEYVPRIQNRFVLITHNSDRNIDEKAVSLAEEKKIIRWFAQNVVCWHPKVQPIPIGLENRCLHNNGIVRDYIALRTKLPPQEYRILYGFNAATNNLERGQALLALRQCLVADEHSWSTSREYRKHLAGYCFVASPPGNGIDCHRTWEAMYLGVIPIVRQSYLYNGLPELPLKIVDSWNEINAWKTNDLHLFHNELLARNSEALWMDHWERLIADAIVR